MNDLFVRSISFSSVDSQYCVQALVMLENRLSRAQSKSATGGPVWRAIGVELEAVQKLRNRFTFIGGRDETTSALGGEQGSILPAVSEECRPDQGS